MRPHLFPLALIAAGLLVAAIRPIATNVTEAVLVFCIGVVLVAIGVQELVVGGKENSESQKG